jgi:hypothetical protein
MSLRVAAIPVLAVSAGLAILLTGCSQQQGLDLARQACDHVTRSIHLFHESEQATDPAAAARLNGEAHAELLDALPLAAEANSDDGQWNALMTTISESARVDERYLVVALTAQCRLANSSQPYQGPAGGGNLPPGSTLPNGGAPTTLHGAATTTTGVSTTSASGTTGAPGATTNP